MGITENVRALLSELPSGVRLLAAAKGRSPLEILEAIEAGVSLVGESYVQEAERVYPVVGRRAEWHFIGHLQKNKVKKAVALFDVIETVDSLEIAREIDTRCGDAGKQIPVLLEINIGREEQKSGVMPEEAEKLARQISPLSNIRISGLMTIGPRAASPQLIRQYFKETRDIFDRIRALKLPNVKMEHLSMGMTGTYRTAIEEGANIIRIGTGIFGARK